MKKRCKERGKGQYEIVYKLISGSDPIILPLTFSLVRTLIRIHLVRKNTGEFGPILENARLQKVQLHQDFIITFYFDTLQYLNLEV